MPAVRSLSTIQHRIRRSAPPVVAMRHSLARTERAGADELRHIQDRRLRALVRWAGLRSPYYREWFRRSGGDPRDIRGVDDLHLLPIIDRRHLAEHPDAFLAYPRRLVWPSHSSGTSGRPITCYRTAGSSMYELAMLQRQWGWFGIRPGSRSVVLRGSTFAGEDESVIVHHNPGAAQMLVSSFRLTADRVPAILAEMRAFNPAVVEGWPSSLTVLAGLLRDAGHTFTVRGVITSSEVITEAQRGLLREVFGGPIIDHYGQTERVVMAGGCEAGGYHLFPEYGIAERVATDTPGEHEVIGTPLHNWGFPIFRYRTGDRTTAVGEGLCACGRHFPLFGLVGGRVEDVARAADGRPVPLASTIIDDLTGLREVQLVQHRPGVFEVKMVPGAGYERAAVEALARANFDAMAGPGQDITFTECDAIPRSASGKLRPVVVLSDGESAPPAEG